MTTEPTICRCPPPVTRRHQWCGDDECARCRRLIWTPPTREGEG